jgi:16S rRNA (guanine(966)-N(2))-methyltransferase RsmD
VRITSGEFGGRNLFVPKTGDIRPTQERVREALFSMLQTEVPGCDFLDLFAGSGSSGLEALSRGARTATFVEINPKHIAVIRRNIELLRIADNAQTIIRADVYKWLERYSGEGFSIVFADPPYALGEEKGYFRVLELLALRSIVRPGGVFAAEMVSSQKTESVSGWEMFRERDYGKTRLVLWRRLTPNT